MKKRRRKDTKNQVDDKIRRKNENRVGVLRKCKRGKMQIRSNERERERESRHAVYMCARSVNVYLPLGSRMTMNDEGNDEGMMGDQNTYTLIKDVFTE